jgi:hypothetical protein
VVVLDGVGVVGDGLVQRSGEARGVEFLAGVVHVLGAGRLGEQMVLGVGSLAVEGVRAEHDHVVAGAIVLPCLLLLNIMLLLLLVLGVHLHGILGLGLDEGMG